MEKIKEQIASEVDQFKEELWEISDYLYHNPELSDEEYQSSKKLGSLLESHGFNVEYNIIGKPTAFCATYKTEKEGPNVAFLCEYDALPGIGHGCGHNMIGTMGAGAGIALSKVIDQIGGNIYVYGTPAEEVNGAKVDMSSQGVFDHIDFAMMVHPTGGRSMSSGGSLALQELKFTYHGRTSHAAASPELGINALDAAILTFNGINALRQHVTSDVRMHGIISNGGQAANIVPDLAKAEFYVRAKKRARMYEVREKMFDIVRSAAKMTGATVDIEAVPCVFEDMNTNRTLANVFDANLEALGHTDILKDTDLNGSLDMGNVSYVVPSIHPFIGLGRPELDLHTTELADYTITETGQERIAQGALAMAQTAFDVIVNPDLLGKIKEEFANSF